MRPISLITDLQLSQAELSANAGAHFKGNCHGDLICLALQIGPLRPARAAGYAQAPESLFSHALKGALQCVSAKMLDKSQLSINAVSKPAEHIGTDKFPEGLCHGRLASKTRKIACEDH